MPEVLDIVALRSLVAIADCGGFHRAAEALRISQSAVSHHTRKLEQAVGRQLLTREGRSMRFTPDGETLLADARVILACHDDALMRLGVGPFELDTLVVGATEHAAEHLLPVINQALSGAYPQARVSFRLDRGAKLGEAMEQGSVDVSLLFGSISPGAAAGELPLAWFSAPGWSVPTRQQAIPLVVMDEPCTIRRQALSSLADARRRTRIVGEAGHLAGVVNAARAGLGVALLADVGSCPEGLTRRDDLPAVPPQPLHVKSRRGADPAVTGLVARAVRSALADR